MAKLYLLGPAEIRKEDGALEHSFLTGPKRLGLLVYLLLDRPRGFHRRDSLLPLFWPDLGQKSARNALSNMLYHIRRTLGPQAIRNRGAEEVQVNTEAFWTDVISFENNIASKTYQVALALYRGELLKGFFVPDASPEFDQWLEQQRERVKSLATEGAWQLSARAEEEQVLEKAVYWGKKAASLNPLCEQTHASLIKLLNRCGDRSGAMELYKNFARRLQQELDSPPSEVLLTAIENIKLRAGVSGPMNGEKHSHEVAKASARKLNSSIAVLPLETMGRETTTTFTDLIHRSILTRLSKNGELEVASRNSVSCYQQSAKTATEIGHELGVGWVVEGEVNESARWLRINIRLISTQTNRQVWAEEFYRELTEANSFEMQDELTRQIAGELKNKLCGNESVKKEMSSMEGFEIFRLYAQGRSCLDQRTESGIYSALGFFRRAIELEPAYALAWSGLADAISLLQFYGYALPKGAAGFMDAALQAEKLDREAGEVQASLGIYYAIQQQGPLALQAFKRAVKLTPDNAEAQVWLGWLNLHLGRPEEALEPAKRGVRLRPLTPAYRIFLAEIYLSNQRYQEGLHEARRAREIQPAYGLAHYIEGLLLYHLHLYKEAEDSLQKALALVPAMGTPNQAEVKVALAFTFAATGREYLAWELVEQIDENIYPFSAGILHVFFGNTRQAFRAFGLVKDWGSFSTEQIRYFFPEALAEFRKQPAFQQLVGNINRAWGLAADGSIPAVEVPSAGA